MPTLTITFSTPDERREYERTIAFVAEMRQLDLTAPHGGVIEACEALCLSKSRDLLGVPGRVDLVVAHPDAPQIWACVLNPPGSSTHDFATPLRRPWTNRAGEDCIATPGDRTLAM
jgi:hypothetical protein